MTLYVPEHRRTPGQSEHTAWTRPAQPAVEKVFKLLTLHMGADVMVAVKARMRDQGSQEAMVAAINATEAAFTHQFPQVQWVFFEPDVAD